MDIISKSIAVNTDLFLLKGTPHKNTIRPALVVAARKDGDFDTHSNLEIILRIKNKLTSRRAKAERPFVDQILRKHCF